MDSNHRFNRDEISKILKRAAELEHGDDIADDSEGLTIEELQQVSEEVGLHPKYIQRALDEIKNPDQSVSSNIFGGPFTYHLTNSASGTLVEKEWEDVVSEIRRLHGGIGKTNKMGATFEWEQRKSEVGYIQIALSPKKGHTKISINAGYTTYATVIYTLVGSLGFSLLMALSASLIKKAGLPITPVLITTGLSMLGLLAGTRFYLSRWMDKKRKTYSKLFDRFKEMIGANSEKENGSDISIPGSNQNKTEQRSIPGRRQRTTRS